MQDINRAIDAHKQMILDAERYIWAHPETGYKEFETSKYLAEIASSAFKTVSSALPKEESFAAVYSAKSLCQSRWFSFIFVTAPLK